MERHITRVSEAREGAVGNGLLSSANRSAQPGCQSGVQFHCRRVQRLDPAVPQVERAQRRAVSSWARLHPGRPLAVGEKLGSPPLGQFAMNPSVSEPAEGFDRGTPGDALKSLSTAR